MIAQQYTESQIPIVFGWLRCHETRVFGCKVAFVLRYVKAADLYRSAHIYIGHQIIPLFF